jgi:hypothetical protein
VNQRSELVHSLLESPERWTDLSERLGTFEWDSDEELVALRPEHLIHVLTCYLSGLLRESDVEGWANAVEGREDIGRSTAAALVNDALHRMANQILEGVITPAAAEEWIERLSG